MQGSSLSTAYPLGLRRTVVVFSGLMLGMLLAAVSQTIVATALPKIVADLGGLDHYSWVVSAYLLASTVTVPLYGKLSDIYGRRELFALAICLFMIGSTVCGLATGMGMLIAGRAVQGLGAGGLIPLAIAAIGDIIAPRERGRWQAVTGAVFGVASVVGPTLGGWIADTASWRWAFFVGMPFGLMALAVVAVGFRGAFERRPHEIDYVGAALLVTGVTAGLLACVWGGSKLAWTSPVELGLFALSLVTLVAFVAWERQRAEPIIPVGLFRERTFAASQAALFTVGAAMFGAIVYVPLFVQSALGRSATSSGAVLTPLMLGLVAASAGAGQIVSRTGRYRALLAAGPLVMAAGFGLLAGLGARSTPGQVTLALTVTGIGLGLCMQTYVVVVQNAVPRRLMGAATAATQFFRQIGATIGVTIGGAVVSSRLADELAARLGPKAAGASSTLAAPRTGGHAEQALASALPAREALASALHPVFVAGVPLLLVAFVCALFVEHIELRRTVGESTAEASVG